MEARKKKTWSEAINHGAGSFVLSRFRSKWKWVSLRTLLCCNWTASLQCQNTNANQFRRTDPLHPSSSRVMAVHYHLHKSLGQSQPFSLNYSSCNWVTWPTRLHDEAVAPTNHRLINEKFKALVESADVYCHVSVLHTQFVDKNVGFVWGRKTCCVERAREKDRSTALNRRPRRRSCFYLRLDWWTPLNRNNRSQLKLATIYMRESEYPALSPGPICLGVDYSGRDEYRWGKLGMLGSTAENDATKVS